MVGKDDTSKLSDVHLLDLNKFVVVVDDICAVGGIKVFKSPLSTVRYSNLGMLSANSRIVDRKLLRSLLTDNNFFPNYFFTVMLLLLFTISLYFLSNGLGSLSVTEFLRQSDRTRCCLSTLMS